MNHYPAYSAAVAAFLAIVVIECAVVLIWRWLEAHDLVAHGPFLEGRERVQARRSMMFWLIAALMFEGGHDLLRASYYYFRLETWPAAASFWLTFSEGVSVLGLIRAFTRQSCGELGWTVSCVLPVVIAVAVCLR